MKFVRSGVPFYDAYSRVTGRLAYRDNASVNQAWDIQSVGPLSVAFLGGVFHRYHHMDHLGSRAASTDAAGAVLERERYAPFGEQLNATFPNFVLGFTGHSRDADTNLNYMQARLYDPLIGRFLSTDPVGYEADLNLYAYVYNDPVNTTDPDGACPPMACGAAASVLLGAIIRGATGGDVFDIAAIGTDAALGAVGAGLVNKAATVVKLARLPKPGIARNKALGDIGEKAAKVTGPREAVSINGRRRIPDQISAKNVTEVKNRAEITKRNADQIADTIAIARDRGLEAQLLLRPGADISRVQGLIDGGALAARTIPGINASGVTNISPGVAGAAGAVSETAATLTNCKFNTSGEICGS